MENPEEVNSDFEFLDVNINVNDEDSIYLPEDIYYTAESPPNVTTNDLKRKGRKKTFQFTREEKKLRKYTNMPHTNYRNEIVPVKCFTDFQCICSLKCNDLVSLQQRQDEFQKFNGLGSWDAQSMFIANCVKEKPIQRTYASKVNPKKKRQFSREYYLCGTKVCREMFVKTLHTNSKRINTSLKKIRSGDSIVDYRGKKTRMRFV